MDKELLPLEERVKKLEQEVERLRRLLESHIRDHGVSPINPDRPFQPKHPDIGPPKKLFCFSILMYSTFLLQM